MATAAPTARLAPWLNHARGYMEVFLSDLAEPRDLAESGWFRWRQTLDSEDDWIRTLETIELLDLFVRVDYRGGWRWIFEAVDLSVYAGLVEKLLPTRIYPKHRFSWDAFAHADQARRLVVAIPDELHTPGFLEVRAEMMRLWKKDRREPDDRIRVSMELDMEAVNDDEPGSVVRALDQLVELAILFQDPTRRELIEQLFQLESETTSADEYPRERSKSEMNEEVVLEGIEIASGEISLTDEMLDRMLVIQQCGLQISSLDVDPGFLTPLNELSLPAVIKYLRASVGSASPATALRTLMIDCDMSFPIFQAICSALASTRSVGKVELKMRSGGDGYWSWIAYALLSGDGGLQLDCVDLGVQQLTLDDVSEIERVLLARDPIAALAPSVRTEASLVMREREEVDVCPHTIGLLRTTATGSNFTIVSIDAAGCTSLRVVDDMFSSTHIGVLYPGAGLCWIPRDGILARRRLPVLDDWPTRHANLHTLKLWIGLNTSIPALLALVQLVGRHVRTFLLVGSDEIQLPDSTLREILAACPQLERLEMTYLSISSFNWLIENDGIQIKALQLKHIESEADGGYAPIIAALRDSSNPLAQTLRDLAIRDYIEDLEPLASGLADMLTTNRQLERLLVRARSDEHTEALQALATLVDSFNDQSLAVLEKPLAVRSRLALLSVFAHRRELSELTDPLLAIVFAFAASNKRRVCGVMHVV